MRRILGSLSLARLSIGLGLFATTGRPGQIVSVNEVDRCMGADCYDPSEDPQTVCFGGNCQSGGCGCFTILALYEGVHQRATATPCDTSWNCTAPQRVLDQLCGGPQ
jgi:hypothetical protein